MKTEKKQEKINNGADKIKNELKEAHAKLNETVEWAHKKYDKMDSGTKNKIIAGLVGTAALIAAAIGAKKIIKGKKD